MTVEAPCGEVYLQGQHKKGVVHLYLDDKVILSVEFKDDDFNQSWEIACGKIQEAVLHNMPNFVRYDSKKK